MRLIADDHSQVYVWVDDVDTSLELSPRFDYEEDAEVWMLRLTGAPWTPTAVPE